MRIAHCVESYAPALGGMPEVVRQISERLVSMGHEVTVFTSLRADRDFTRSNGVLIRSFAISGNSVKGIRGDAEAYWNALRNGGFDVVTFFAAQQWATDIALPRAKELNAKKVFVPTGFSSLHDPAFIGYYARMPEWMQAMDLNVFPSHTYQDIRFAEAHGIRSNAVIPNGAAAEEFDGPIAVDVRVANGITPDERMIVHVGSFTGIKGHVEAIRIFLAARAKDTALVLIGNGNHSLERAYLRHWRFFIMRMKARLRRKRIFFLELDRTATVSAMKQADLFLFPSQVECSPIVLFEAMAAGVPFLSSTAGNSNEIVSWSHGGWTMPGTKDPQGRTLVDITKGARMLGELLAHPEMLDSAGSAGLAAWQERFTWKHIAEQYAARYAEIAGGHHG